MSVKNARNDDDIKCIIRGYAETSIILDTTTIIKIIIIDTMILK